jgi:hypothetical protein
MKNLDKTIERILKVDPTLEEKLIPIKNKFKKFPDRHMSYWKELITLLNNDPSITNSPKRAEISKIFTVKKRTSHQQLNSFKVITPADRIIGVIPENFSDEIKRHDREYIAIAKLNVEAVLTDSSELKAEVLRRGNLLEIHNKKIWLKLRDYFKLWDKPANCTIKKQENGLLAMVDTQPLYSGISGMPGRPQLPDGQSGPPSIFRVDPNSLRQLFQALGFEPPPDEE